MNDRAFYMNIYDNLLCDQWADSTLTHENNNAESGSSHWSRHCCLQEDTGRQETGTTGRTNQHGPTLQTVRLPPRAETLLLREKN